MSFRLGDSSMVPMGNHDALERTSIPSHDKTADILVADATSKAPSSSRVDAREHRLIFDREVARSMPIERGSRIDSSRNKKLFTTTDYEEYIRILRFWNQEEGHVDATTGEHVSQKEFRKRHGRKWYNTEKNFRVRSLVADDGTTISYVLERSLVVKNHPERWRLVAHVGNVYDILWECHLSSGHQQTVDELKSDINQRYWNVNNHLFNFFIETCPGCISIKKRRKTGESKRNACSQWFERFEIDLLEFPMEPRYDLGEVQMNHILILYDRQSNWIMLRPMKNLDPSSIVVEVQVMIGCRGFPRTLKISDITNAISEMVESKLSNKNQSSTDVQSNTEIVRNTISMLQQEEKDQGRDISNWTGLIAKAMMIINVSYKERRKTGAEDQPATTHVDTIASSRDIVDEDHDRSNSRPGEKTDETILPSSSTQEDGTPFMHSSATLILTEKVSHVLPQSSGGTKRQLEDISDSQVNNLAGTESVPPPETETHQSTDMLFPDSSETVLYAESRIVNGSDIKDSYDSINTDTVPPAQSDQLIIDEFTRKNTVVEPLISADITTENRESEPSSTQVDEEFVDAYMKSMELHSSFDIRSFFETNSEITITIPAGLQVDTDPLGPSIQAKRPTKEHDDSCLSPASCVIEVCEDLTGAVHTGATALNLRKTCEAITIEQALIHTKTPVKTISGTAYRICYPRLVCDQCDEYVASRLVMVAEEKYYVMNRVTKRWWDSDMVQTFGILCAHDAHRDDMVYIDVSVPTKAQHMKKSKSLELPKSVKHLVSILHRVNHFAVIRLDIQDQCAFIYDGRPNSTSIWSDHFNYILNRYGFDEKEWTLKRGQSSDLGGLPVVQSDTYNCGPIACIILWRILKPQMSTLQYLDQSVYRKVVVDQMLLLIQRHQSCLVVYKRKKRFSSHAESNPIQHRGTTTTPHVSSQDNESLGILSSLNVKNTQESLSTIFEQAKEETPPMILPDSMEDIEEFTSTEEGNRTKNSSTSRTRIHEESIQTKTMEMKPKSSTIKKGTITNFFERSVTATPTPLTLKRPAAGRTEPVDYSQSQSSQSTTTNDVLSKPILRKNHGDTQSSDETILKSDRDQPRNVKRSVSSLFKRPNFESSRSTSISVQHETTVQAKSPPQISSPTKITKIPWKTNNVYDGLHDSSDDESSLGIQQNTLQQIADTPSQKKKRKISPSRKEDSSPKPSQTFRFSKVNTGTILGNCKCKKGCNNHCGCKKKRIRCGTSCSCKGLCSM